jgi:putative phage-type endonuclease
MKKRDRWLAHRRQFVTASDVGAILGFVKWRSRLDVYCEKRGLTDGPDDNEFMKWGRRLEDPIAQGFAEDTGRFIERFRSYELVPHPDISWLAATPDRGQSAPDDCIEPAPEGAVGNGILEIKNSQIYWKDSAPIPYHIQLQVQLSCTGRNWGTICELYRGSQLRHEDVLRDDKFLAVALEKLEEFWWMVKNGKPPEPTQPSDLKVVKQLYLQADNTEAEPRKLSESDEQMLVELEALKASQKATEGKLGLLEAKIRASLGESTHGKTPTGGMLIAKQTNVKGRTQIVEPYSYRKLVWHPSKEKGNEEN